jgi:preprotein translocase subunit SecG
MRIEVVVVVVAVVVIVVVMQIEGSKGSPKQVQEGREAVCTYAVWRLPQGGGGCC